MEKIKSILKKYVCPWCNHEFEQLVSYNANFDKHTMKQKKKGISSSQVKCPNCLNFIPTWKREETENLLGKKHIHLR